MSELRRRLLIGSSNGNPFAKSPEIIDSWGTNMFATPVYKDGYYYWLNTDYYICVSQSLLEVPSQTSSRLLHSQPQFDVLNGYLIAAFNGSNFNYAELNNGEVSDVTTITSTLRTMTCPCVGAGVYRNANCKPVYLEPSGYYFFPMVRISNANTEQCYGQYSYTNSFPTTLTWLNGGSNNQDRGAVVVSATGTSYSIILQGTSNLLDIDTGYLMIASTPGAGHGRASHLYYISKSDTTSMGPQVTSQSIYSYVHGFFRSLFKVNNTLYLFQDINNNTTSFNYKICNLDSTGYKIDTSNISTATMSAPESGYTYRYTFNTLDTINFIWCNNTNTCIVSTKDMNTFSNSYIENFAPISTNSSWFYELQESDDSFYMLVRIDNNICKILKWNK